ncbi:hypothetical protein M407DRAFT_182246 [Tulasnella calospora MUT 4182]|uniref:DDE Tnp4 domain-containing protein n=1 Tax=Tulasnella calospora MUT 4182 TaxID=1051891 RepID=A0A0C3QN49_9AGAM|nr:hypothetical protein M407DRAFT_182246 [Tulasnella calospora MUT 4182]
MGRMRPGGRVDLARLGSDIWMQQFRFTWAEVTELAAVLDLPADVVAENGVREDRVTALAMLLRRLAYPARSSDVEMMFGWERSRFSRICQTTASLIYHRWRHLLRFDPTRLTASKLQQYAEAISSKCGFKVPVWGFIDGTLRKVAHPILNQRILYNGWKRIHALKWHSVITPDGLHAHVFGPVEGRRHDETLYKESGLAAILDEHSWDPEGNPLAVYGDPAYGIGRHLLSPFKGASLSDEEQAFNAQMSKVREAVEWGFGDAVHQFAFLDFSKNLKVLLQPVGLLYSVALLLSNAHTILHQPQISQYFICQPPTLQEYFNHAAHPEVPFGAIPEQEVPWTAYVVPEEEAQGGSDIEDDDSI